MTPASTVNFNRVCRVIVGKDLEQGVAAGIQVEGFRIKFTVDQTLRGPPNTANIQIYNLSPVNELRIKKEFDEVLLECGYVGNSRVVFRGNIKFPSHYRDGNDWVTEIQAADGDRAYTTAHVGTTLAAGRTPGDAVDEILKTMPGVRKGIIELPTAAYLRGRVLSGAARRVLDNLAQDHGAHWSILNGTLNIVRADRVLPGQAVLVNAQTGMLGAPEISGKGVKVKMQLNPMVVPNVALKLNNNDIKIQTFQLYASGSKTKAKKLVRLDPDGIYKTFKVRIEGDTRGPDWYTEAETIGVGQPIPAGKAA